MNSVGALVLITLVLVVLFSQRRWAFLAIVAGVLYLTEGQSVAVMGFNMFPARFLELAGFIRVLTRREFSFRQLTRIDYALIWLYLYTTVVFLLRSKDGQAYEIGTAVDALLCYFIFRGLLVNMEDFRWFLRTFVFLLAPYAMLVLAESFTGHNPFAMLGGVEGAGHWMRHGRPRCFGSFRQPDTLGMFAASFIPLYIGMACIVKERRRALFAIGLCLCIVWAANSGGETAGAIVGVASWGLWRYRTQMRKVRWGIVAMIVGLALVMKAPVWYIFARVSSITGGDGWHRSHLIQVAYEHLSQWWFIGMPMADTNDWFPYNLATTGHADITNQYISFGLNAGVAAIALFIVLLTRAFSGLGKALAVVRNDAHKSSSTEFMLWGLGVMLVVHIVNWFGITYFDQMYAVWFMELAVITTMSEAYLKQPALQSEEVVESAEEANSLNPLVVKGLDGR